MAASSSMEPILFKGDIVKVDLNVPVNEIYAAPKNANPPGDIISYRGPTELIVHRATQKTNNPDGTYSFTTQGDANSYPDPKVDGRNVVGKVVDINPPFWTYNFLFWGALLVGGLILLVIGVIVIAIAA